MGGLTGTFLQRDEITWGFGLFYDQGKKRGGGGEKYSWLRALEQLGQTTCGKKTARGAGIPLRKGREVDGVKLR